jgi:predicted SnoaL-like aldol condensation-catalyzing enzyme
VKDGKEGFIEFFADFVERNPNRKIEIVRGFEDGRYVFLHAMQTLNGGESRWVTADIFDTDDQGRMIEHWDIIGEWVDDTVSGHTQVDGPTEPIDLDRTAENKALVTGFVNDVLKAGKFDKLTDYISTETFIQHNPQVGDGLDGLGAFVNSLSERGVSMVYEKIHRVVGCGSFVAVLSKMNLAGTGMAAIDLFRVDGGRIVEHWDVMEEILPEDQWVNSGKF